MSAPTVVAPTTVTLGEELTIPYAADVVAQVTAALDTAPPVLHLDLAAVEELDTAGLQVLLWTARETRSRAIALRLTGSPAVAQVLAIAGLELTDLASTGGAS